MANAAQKRHSGSAFETQRIIEAGKRKLQKWQKMTTGKRRWQVRGGGKSRSIIAFRQCI